MKYNLLDISYCSLIKTLLKKAKVLFSILFNQQKKIKNETAIFSIILYRTHSIYLFLYK